MHHPVPPVHQAVTLDIPAPLEACQVDTVLLVDIMPLV